MLLGIVRSVSHVRLVVSTCGTSVSGVGVLDKAMAVLRRRRGAAPRSLAELVEATGLSRPTAHRLAVALEAHGLVRRDADGRFALGLRLVGARPRRRRGAAPGGGGPAGARRAARRDRRERAALRARRRPPGVRRVARVAARLRTIVPVGAALPLDRGSAGTVLRGDAAVLRRGWAESVGRAGGRAWPRSARRCSTPTAGVRRRRQRVGPDRAHHPPPRAGATAAAVMRAAAGRDGGR